VGFGNDGARDGVATPTITATYAHGPVLALNPWLADELLGRALGREIERRDADLAWQLHWQRRVKLTQVAEPVSRRPLVSSAGGLATKFGNGFLNASTEATNVLTFVHRQRRSEEDRRRWPAFSAERSDRPRLWRIEHPGRRRRRAGTLE
jgi:hypothetical protein